jgi:beta-phosphoglucomutase-like phosphatase (HAD superfamily)
MTRLAQCEAVIFDSDGVLVDSEVIHIAVERELLAELGLHYDYPTYLSRFVGLSNTDFRAALQADYSALGLGTFPEDFGDRLNAHTWPRMEAELAPIEGVSRLVEVLKGKVAVGSSAPIERLRKKLTLTALIGLFDPHIYSVDHVDHGKPAPDLFLHAAQQLGAAPHSCAVIEDSVNGLKAAKAAGMFAIGFVGGSHADDGLAARLKEAGADMIADSHDEIAASLA